MTAFKERLDKELGTTPRFTQSLQKNISQQVHRVNPTTRRWQYPLIILGTIVMLLFIIELGPLGRSEQAEQTSFVELAQQETIKRYTMIFNANMETFMAGRPGWTIGQKIFELNDDKDLLQQLLQQATVTQMYGDNPFRFGAMRDVWAEFENGQVIKMKIFLNEEYIVIEDYHNKSFYRVNNEDLAKAYLDLALKEDDIAFGMKGLSIFLVVLFVSHFFVGKLMRKKFNIPKGYVNKGHQRVSWIIKIVNIVLVCLFVLKGLILLTVVIIGYLTVIVVSSIFIDYYYGREEKRHYLSISSAIVGLLLFGIFIIYIS
ncbi:DUF4181 domain-containing protein [Lysinibacillus sphaericus]|uniref:DUF4181 domain-containing protein n=1 Tax=Lysinibacillus sphaericus TaxID=1421 RepID=UPI0004DFCC21|nr:DUF4181 domain-containing protein [Lysinibacillus sphaericus]QPA57929.1 DUF4181 domain-containing protein [Lysinibacillus sphaericus]